ncbi:hypothetical protein KP509_04G029600 [Ceratopteris richardii]|uniref:PROP1-like PPR domain-containing protein n=2 Tax=Ceratopteris richardii TaxID=49495 RepID=A0A8T2UYW4_CERRI|nr:hypothetical protein KP509_04G029600 [Ceratopteris richardii]
MIRKYLKRYRPSQIFEAEKLLAQKKIVTRICDALKDEEDVKVKLEGLNVQLSPAVVVDALSRLQPHAAWEFFNWARFRDGFKHDRQTYGAMIKRFEVKRNADHLKQLFEDMKTDGCEMLSGTYTSFIRAYGKAGKFEEAMQTWEKLKQSGLKLDTAQYNCIIGLLLHAKENQRALQCYKEMLQLHCAPDAHTYHYLIESLVRAGKLESAFTIIKKMPRLGVRPYQQTYTMLVHACLKAGDLDTALGSVLHMKVTHRDPNRKTMKKVRRACEKAGRSTDILAQYWEPYFAYSAEPSSGDTSGSGKSDEGTTTGSEFEDTDEDLEVDKNTLASILTPWNESTAAVLKKMDFQWTTQIAAYLMKDLEDADVAFGFFEWLRNVPEFKHDELTYIKMIIILLSARRFPLVDILLNEMHEQGLEVPCWVFNQIVECYSSCRDAAGALKVLDKMAQMGTRPDSAVYTGVIDVLMRDGMYQRAMEVYGQMLQAGHEPNNFTYSVLINGLGLAGKAEAAHKLLGIMHKHGYKPNVITYTALIGGYEKLGKIANVIEVYKEMQEAGIEPTPITYRVLSQAFYRAGKWDEGKNFEEKMQNLISSDIGSTVMEDTRRSSCKEILEMLEGLAVLE